MTIQEMHIEVGLASQQVASAVNRRFLPEEIDWILNKTIERFVKDCVKPKEYAGESDFQEYQIDTDKIRTLIAHDTILPVTVSGHTYTAILPHDYAYLVEDSSFIQKQDKHNRINPVSEEIHIAALRFKPSGKKTGPYYTDTILKVNGVTIELGDLPASFPSKDMLFILVEAIREALPSGLPAGVKVYWERYGDFDIQNTLLFVSGKAVDASISYDGTTYKANLQHVQILRPFDRGTSRKVVNRLSKSDRIGKLQQSSFANSKSESPLSVLESNVLKVYGADSFTVTQVAISYVRKARKVSLSLNRNCNLPEETHQQICDLAVEYIEMTIQDKGYTAKLQDNKLRH